MDTFRFLDFPVYREAKLFNKRCRFLTKNFSREFWELGDQLRRASLSICLNIAEGSAKYSDKDFKRYIENSLGSVNESYACLDIACDNELISESQLTEMKTQAGSIAKQLGGFAKKLRSSR